MDGILVTHEHSDHIQGLGVFSRKYAIPIYATPGTIRGIERSSSLGKMPEGLLHPIETDKMFQLGDTIFIHFRFCMMQMNHADIGWRMQEKQLQLRQILEHMMITS